MPKPKPGTFSLRYGLRPRPAGLLYDSVPKRVRFGLMHLLDECAPYITETILYKEATGVLHLRRDSMACDFPEIASTAVKNIVETCDWWAFYDLCEVIVEHLRGRSPAHFRAFQVDANRLFEEEYIGWRLKGGLVERVGTEQSQRLVDQARQWLEDTRFAGTEEQFEKALRSLSARPEPDTANCVKDAVGALEGVARIVTGKKSAVLSDIVKDLRGKKVIHGALAKCFDGLYAYRGDAEGAAHGAVTGVAVPVAEAEAALNMSASLIIYLANKAAAGEL
jgi:hypothetical protein